METQTYANSTDSKLAAAHGSALRLFARDSLHGSCNGGGRCLVIRAGRREKLLRSLSRGKCAARNNMGSVGLREDENVLWGGVDTEDAAPFGL